jgi:glycosyltransferase involved in cell wall biosynthesis
MSSQLLAQQAPDARRPPAPARRRRVLLAVNSAKLGGAERMALLEAEYLKARFELVVSVPDGPLRARFLEHAELVQGIATLPLWGASARRWAAGSARTLPDAFRMARLIRSKRIELVLTNSSVCLAAVLAARMAGVPAVVHARDVPKSRLAPLVLALHAMLASTVIVITDALTPYFRGGRQLRIVQVVDGIAMPPPPRTQAPRAMGSPLRLCLVGAIDSRKGQDIAVAALARLRDRGIAAKLELVGRELDRPFAAALREQLQQFGLTREVKFVGEVGDVAAYLQRADIVIAPSRGEWTPLVLMEALAHGKPVVAARVGGVPRVVRNGESGVLVAPESPAELADAIAQLLADPVRASTMAQRGRCLIDADFRIEHTLQGLCDELDQLLERSDSARSSSRRA